MKLIWKLLRKHVSIGQLAGFFLANLLPVTIGNIIGGACVIPFAYYYAYKKK